MTLPSPIDTDIDHVRSQLRLLQLERRRAQLRFERQKQSLEWRMNVSSSKLSRQLGSRNHPVYGEAMDDVFGPNMYTRLAVQLLELSHLCEVGDRSLDLAIANWRTETDYMVCEIQVLTKETQDVQATLETKLIADLEAIDKLRGKLREARSNCEITTLPRSTLPRSKASSWRTHSSRRLLQKDEDDASSLNTEHTHPLSVEGDDESFGSLASPDSSRRLVRSTFKPMSAPFEHDELVNEDCDGDGDGSAEFAKRSRQRSRKTTCALAAAPLIEQEELEVVDF